MKNINITILGCGGSGAVPEIGNFWGICDPNEPRNRRSRPSVAVQSGTTTLAVDTGPDFRFQWNTYNMPRPSAVLYTHAHADHIHGIDELQKLMRRGEGGTEIYGNKNTIDEIVERFPYLFRSGLYGLSFVLQTNMIAEDQMGKAFTVGDIPVIAFNQDHGSCVSVGYRFGDVAYSTDMCTLDDAAFAALAGVKTWIVGVEAYHNANNKAHAHLDRLYAYNQIVKAERVVLTHLSHHIDYATLRDEVPSGFEPAYDGLVVTASV
jgi:phosphoribosyl 1,2-cyclic phosphate phosphodiesterase